MNIDHPYRIAGHPDSGFERQAPHVPRAASPDPDDEITPPGEADDDLDLEEDGDDDEFEDGDDDDEDAEDGEEEPGETEPE